MKFKHFIWDFDGTIFDSYPHTLRCCWDAMEEAGLTDGWDRKAVLSRLLVSFGDNAPQGTVITAVYNASGRMLAADMTAYTAAAVSSVSAPTGASTYSVIFLADETTLKPVSAPLSGSIPA